MFDKTMQYLDHQRYLRYLAVYSCEYMYIMHASYGISDGIAISQIRVLSFFFEHKFIYKQLAIIDI